MRLPARFWSPAVIAVAFLCVSVGLGDSYEQFQKGRKLYQDRQYDAAVDALTQVDRTKLTATEQTELDDMLQKARLATATAPSGAAQDTGGNTLIDTLRRDDDLLWQRAVAKMQENAEKAGSAVAEERWNDARQLAEQAIQVIEAARAYAQPPSKYDAAHQVALDLKESVQKQYDEWSVTQADRIRREVRARIDQRRAAQEQERLEKIEQLFSTADQLSKERRFSEAAEAVRQILHIDPANERAAKYLDIYDDFASFAEQRDLDREFGVQSQSLEVELREARIPWHHDVLYPRNWPEISARRDRVRNAGSVDADSELNRRLEERIAEVNFEETPLEQVVEFLTDLQGVNITVDWQDLESQGIEREKPVTVKMRDVAMRTAIKEVLTQVGGQTELGFAIGEGLLRIATKAKLNRDKFINVYDIRDLIVKIPRFKTAPQLDMGQAGPDGAGAPGLGTSFQNVFGGDRGSPQSEEERKEKSGEADSEMADKIMSIIRETVEPDSWRENGGGEGALRELNGQLIVYNTADAQGQVISLLDQLRQSRALMISVEARFLIVTSNFLEEIGVDLDFVFNAGNAGFDPAFNQQGVPLIDPFTEAAVLIPRQLSRAGVTPGIPALGGGAFPQTIPQQPYANAGFVPAPGGVIPSSDNFSPIPTRQGSLNLVDPVGINTGVPGSLAQAVSANPGLQIAGSWLDNLQVDFLIRATQANRRSSVVQAPRLMLFNGQRAWVAVVRNRQYVSTVTANVAEGAVGVQPVTNNATSGTSLDIDGTISANRKYVTLTVRTGLASEPTFERFQVQQASGNSPGIFILLPDQETRGIRTTVSVPDGGTVLLGGLKQVGEVEIEAGVPILSKIPILKRAFTNTTTVKDTQTLLMLLKAKILIQDEAEAEAFPTLTSALGG